MSHVVVNIFRKSPVFYTITGKCGSCVFSSILICWSSFFSPRCIRATTWTVSFLLLIGSGLLLRSLVDNTVDFVPSFFFPFVIEASIISAPSLLYKFCYLFKILLFVQFLFTEYRFFFCCPSAPALSLLMPAFSLPYAPALLTVCLRCGMERSSTVRLRELAASVHNLFPIIYGATLLDQ